MYEELTTGVPAGRGREGFLVLQQGCWSLREDGDK